MSPLRRTAALAFLLLLGVGAWLAFRPRAAPAAQAALTLPAPSAAELPRRTSAPTHSPLADELHAAAHPPAHDLVVLRGLLGQFTTTFRLGQRPPLGDNADITAALTGRNPQRLTFVPPGHPAVRVVAGAAADGQQLVDRWGTPYHFHARSAETFDVRSAGPDHQLFTADDLVLEAGSSAP